MLKFFVTIATIPLLLAAASCSSGPSTTTLDDAEPTTGVAEQARTRDWVGPLTSKSVAGFVVLADGTPKWRTADEARSQGPRREQGSSRYIVHEVVEDLGDVVSVAPVDFDESRRHCYVGSWWSRHYYRLVGFVHKGALEPLLAERRTVNHADGSWVLGEGIVVDRDPADGYFVRGRVFNLPLDGEPLLRLSYPGSVRMKHRYPFYSGWPEDQPTEPDYYIDYGAEMKIGGVTLDFKQPYDHQMAPRSTDYPRFSNARLDAIAYIQEHKTLGETSEVVVAESCMRITASIPTEQVREGAPQFGAIASIGNARDRTKEDKPKEKPPKPPPPLHRAAEGSPLVWESDGLPAGTLVESWKVLFDEAGICSDVAQGIVGDDRVCIPASAQRFDCTENCLYDAKCTAGPDNNSCVVGSDEDCRQSQLCRERGGCRAKDGECVAASDDDCKDASVCEDGGQCHARDGRCVALSEADCKASNACKYRSVCLFKEGRCVVKLNPNCKSSKRCKEAGRCGEDERGYCVVDSDASCAASETCRKYGNCAFPTRHKGRPIDRTCEASSKEHCRASERCKNQGVCGFRYNRCIQGTDADCKASNFCKERGRCSLITEEVEDKYGASGTLFGDKEDDKPPTKTIRYCGAKDDDCKASTWCKKHNMCTPKHGYETIPPKPQPAGRSLLAELGALNSVGFGGEKGWYCVEGP